MIGYNTRMVRVRLLLTLGVLGVSVLSLGGCRTPMERLDDEMAQMIARRQALSLGEQGANDPQGLSPYQPSEQVAGRHEQKPATTNPSSDQLPAEAVTDAAKVDANGLDMPRMLDDPEGAVEMDLEAVLAYAIEHSPEYRNRKEDLYLTILSLIAERHLWGPRFFDTVTSRATGTPESGDFDTANTLVNEFRVTQRLPYGGEVEASVLVDYVNYLQRSEASVASDVDRETQGSSVALSIDLPLLRGAGQVAREDLIQAERDVIYAVRRFERFRREFLVTISNTYFDLIRRLRSLDNQEFQVANLQRLAERFEALAEAGRQPPFEAEFAGQSVLFERNNLLNAEESYAAAIDSFKIRIGYPTVDHLVIVPAEIEVPTPRLDPVKAVQVAWENRLDLQTSRDGVRDARRQVDVAENRMLPDLDLFATASAPSTSSKQRAGIDLQLDEGVYTAGATLSLPLDRRIERTQIRRAQIGFERQKRSYQLLRDQIALQVRRSVRSIEQARITLELQVRNVALAERRSVGVQMRERQLGPRDVIEAQEDLLAAKDRRDAAVADLRRNVLQYLLDSGQMRVSSEGQWQAPAKLIQEQVTSETRADRDVKINDG